MWDCIEDVWQSEIVCKGVRREARKLTIKLKAGISQTHINIRSMLAVYCIPHNWADVLLLCEGITWFFFFCYFCCVCFCYHRHCCCRVVVFFSHFLYTRSYVLYISVLFYFVISILLSLVNLRSHQFSVLYIFNLLYVYKFSHLIHFNLNWTSSVLFSEQFFFRRRRRLLHSTTINTYVRNT